MAKPYMDNLKKFNEASGYELNYQTFERYLGTVFATNQKTSEYSDSIRNKIRNWLNTETTKYEQYRQEMMLKSKAKPEDTELENKVKKMPTPGVFVEDCINIFMQIAEDIAKEKRRKFTPMPRFGLTGEDYVNLMTESVESYKYSQGRRYELFKAYGIEHPRFTEELNALNITNYAEADDQDKEKIHQIYISKKLTEERLKKHIFLWKWIHWSETKAMKAYVKAANEKLRAAGFPLDSVPHEAENYGNKSYGMVDPEQKGEFLDDCEAWRSRVNSARESEKNARIARREEKQAKEAENKRIEQEQKKLKEKQDAAVQFEKDLASTTERRAKLETPESINAIAEANDGSKPLEDRFFDTKFRPSVDPEEYKKMDEAIRRVSKNVPKDAPQKMRHVLFQNVQKMKLAGEYLKKIGSLNEDQRKLEENKFILELYTLENAIEKTVNKPMSKDKSEKYEPLKYDDIKAEPKGASNDLVNNANEEDKALHMQLENEINKDLNNDKAPVVANEENDKIAQKSMN